MNALRDAPPDGWSVLFEDETDIHWLPLLANSWTKNRVQVQVPTRRDNDKRYCFGAVDFHTRKSYFRLSRKKDSNAFLLFLKRLMSRASKKIILVSDKYSVHKT